MTAHDVATDTAPACLRPSCDCTGCSQCITAERTAMFARFVGEPLPVEGASCFCYLNREIPAGAGRYDRGAP